MKPAAKWLFTAISVTFAALGVLAIVTEVHTGATRRQGIVTVFGDDAVWIGQTCLLLAALPLAVWLPARWVGKALVLWWLALMALLYAFVFLR
ncbi:hypothetical protein [Hydrogenophaga sp.]|jgi:hypothetical protein|uniref:hypothetical protein n=1 Tax=Hydrogenophaga sp. TaxID=1904254 RepID=UPI00271961CF|nr:hypothetical protein [Hydrogenophaga sp.]MDZ4358229.1 hypothetical protein [Variovorax sp.]MDO9250762.1 hypothetical protein [Hydrogenophaga sp.]MDP2408005.1 hypothetical protein [Hydrogenophaga sp.]MDP3325405.1 hypothetical protein [Hydrogenophaga sp.]MDP3885735.1 hypothetical protein [Hydrogenophaga sp.]